MRKPTLSTSLGTWLRRGGGVKLAPLVLALGAAFLALRSAPRAGAAAEAPGYLAYYVAAGKTISFPVEPDDDDLALTVHIAPPDLWPDGQRVQFPISARFVDEAGAELWRGRAVLEAMPAGAIADGEHMLTSPRVVRLELPPRSRGARLQVTVEPQLDAAVASAVAMRLSRRAPRNTLWQLDPARADEHTRKIAERSNTFGWAYIADDRLAELYTRPISRRAADEEGTHDLVHVRPIPSIVDAPAEMIPGVVVNAARGAAWTVRGPGRIHLELTPEAPPEDGSAIAFQLRIVDNSGTSVPVPAVTFAEGIDYEFDAPAEGALSVIALCDDPIGLRARAFVEGGAMPLGDAVTIGPGGEIRPDERRLPLWRVASGGKPMVATLAGDGMARISARALPGTVPALHFRIIGADGRVLSESDGNVFAPPSRLELVELGSELVPAAEALTFLASAPPGARLEVSATAGAADLTIEAPDDPADVRPEAAYEVPLLSTRLRFAPYLRRRWVAFRPDNHAELRSAGAESTLLAQVRLEPTGSPPGGGPYVALEPLAPRTRQLLVERSDEAPARWARFWRTGFATGDPARLAVAATGAAAGRVALDYHVGPEALGGTMRVIVDGALRAERRLAMTRGRIRLDQIAPGTREVVVEGAPGLLFTDIESAGGGKSAPYAERAVWRIDEGGSLVVPVRLGERQGKTLHVVLYSEDPPAATGLVTATVGIDSGARGAGVQASTGRTRLQREVQVVTQPVVSRWLDRAGGARAQAHFAVRLGQDLGAGTHHVRVTLADGGGRMHARFYVTGAPTEPVVTRLGPEWDED